uniref:Glutaredoxin domain-containing protein n=1 Tax=Kalanchoe fedtschenkoi TaxID=63787 RepID=A0A7N1A0N2_KALFE
MGCANSNQSKYGRCNNGPASPIRRSITLHHLDVVSRRSTTLGSFNHDESSLHSPPTLGSLRQDESSVQPGLDRNAFADQLNDELVHGKSGFENKRTDQFSVGLTEAKTWSGFKEERIPKMVPKTPVRTPPGEPESINLWELMEGLEDISPLIKPLQHFKGFSFDVAGHPEPLGVLSLTDDCPKSRLLSVKTSPDTGPMAVDGLSHSSGMDSPEVTENELSCTEHENGRCSHMPKRLEMDSEENFTVPDFDPEILSMFRNSLEDPSPGSPFDLSLEDDGTHRQPLVSENIGTDHYLFQSSKKDRVIVYFTSLRGIRKTYEDCCHVRVILKGTGVRVDEKDLSMHSGFKEELKESLRNNDASGGWGLPRVFIGKKYVGGVDEIRRLHEDEQLEKLVEGCEMVDSSGHGGKTACEGCGDIRFIPYLILMIADNPFNINVSRLAPCGTCYRPCKPHKRIII